MVADGVGDGLGLALGLGEITADHAHGGGRPKTGRNMSHFNVRHHQNHDHCGQDERGDVKEEERVEGGPE